jgi:hypothetical protein
MECAMDRKQKDILDAGNNTQKGRFVLDDPPEDDAEVIKLEIGQAIEGILTDKRKSVTYKNRLIYEIKCKNDDMPKIIVGTTILDQWMKNKNVGDLVKIVRLADIKTDKPNPMQDYEVYHWEE